MRPAGVTFPRGGIANGQDFPVVTLLARDLFPGLVIVYVNPFFLYGGGQKLCPVRGQAEGFLIVFHVVGQDTFERLGGEEFHPFPCCHANDFLVVRQLYVVDPGPDRNRFYGNAATLDFKPKRLFFASTADKKAL